MSDCIKSIYKLMVLKIGLKLLFSLSHNTDQKPMKQDIQNGKKEGNFSFRVA